MSTKRKQEVISAADIKSGKIRLDAKHPKARQHSKLKITDIQRLNMIAQTVELLRGTHGAVAHVDRTLQSETELHVACAAWLRTHPDKRVRRAFSIANESPRSKLYGQKLVLQGLTGGVADIFIPVPVSWDIYMPTGMYTKHCSYAGLFVELKWGGNDLTEGQYNFLCSMEDNHYAVIVVHSFSLFTSFVEEYLTEPQHFIGGI